MHPEREQEHFNPRSPRGERPKYRSSSSLAALFQSTLPAWGATYHDKRQRAPSSISIHAPRVGATSFTLRFTNGSDNFNPRSPRGERHLSYVFTAGNKAAISIHAPRVGSDQVNSLLQSCSCIFQSTLPAWGATMPKGLAITSLQSFQSTLPAWGATRHIAQAGIALWYFNPRSPRGERPSGARRRLRRSYFNPRSPRGERRAHDRLGGAVSGYFNPRSPRGERPRSAEALRGAILFQSTLPAWGATRRKQKRCYF